MGILAYFSKNLPTIVESFFEKLRNLLQPIKTRYSLIN